MARTKLDSSQRTELGDALLKLRSPMPGVATAAAYAAPPQSEVPELPRHITMSSAEWTYTRLMEYIKDFEEGLDDEHEVGARLVSFGQAVVFHIQRLGFYGPDIITFYGTDEQGQALQLIQNVSQLSVLLMAMKKQADKPRRIGFLRPDEPAE